MPSFVEKILAIAGALENAELPHAFGGAIALGYYATPRTTIDIDINVFVSPDSNDAVRRTLEPLGIDRWPTRKLVMRDAQYRARWDRTAVDVFLSDLPLHDEMQRARRRVPFADRDLWILSPEHLAICKAMFDRTKDWTDLSEMVLATSLDTAMVLTWLSEHLPEGDERLTRCREAFG